MSERQNIEYKTSWHDDHLKWICGFANANGGTLYIGKDDSGNIVDVVEYKKLMEDLPNKIRDILGVMTEVNLLEDNKRHYIEILIPSYSVPISFKIGRFGKMDDDLKFKESEDGNLIHCLQEVPALLNHKFFTKMVDFEGLQRIEKGEYPVAALREMLLNALVHRDYMGSNVQIRMYEDRFSIWNEGFLPEGLSLEALKRQHPSRPRNPIIADVCFKGGYIDAWGRGILKMINACKLAGLPEPEIKEQDGGLLVTLLKDRYTAEQLSVLGLNDRQVKAVNYVGEYGQITNKKYVEVAAISPRQALIDLKELVEKNVLVLVGKGRSARYSMRK